MWPLPLKNTHWDWSQRTQLPRPGIYGRRNGDVDLLSNGRFDFGIGRGQVVYEYANFKVDFETRTQRFNEIVILYWAMEYAGFTYQANIFR
ncbi:MAG: hypothetical protein Ct9H300mP11_21010 [Chloroflexota bacterium]|nr:MAG: hypothetical protein Ct9H300mP11_21010 [Chloroflexota bacterium]